MQTQTQRANRLKLVLALPAEPIVRVVGYAYLVDLGREVKPRLHTVHKDRSCNCGDTDCSAVQTVQEWITNGRIERAPDPPLGYTPYLPKSCPVCGAKVATDHTLSSRVRGIGWQCSTGGAACYWQSRASVLKQLSAGHEWVFPPVADETGRVLYPGVRVSDVPARAPMGYLPECNH